MSALPPIADIRADISDVRFAPKADIDGLRGPLTDRLVSDRNYAAFQGPSALWFADYYCVSGKILVAHADCYPTAQSPELRPYNRDISVEGKR